MEPDANRTRRDAPEHPLPSSSTSSSSKFFAVEYPGFVRPTPASLANAITTLGGQRALDDAFRRTGGRKAEQPIVELAWRPGNPFAHPIAGSVVNTDNLVLKVVRRRRKRVEMEVDGEEGNGKGKGKAKEAGPIGEYVAEVVGTIPKTVRFRAMADFQYQPDMNDRIAQLRLAMERMDVNAIREFTILPEQENYRVPVYPFAVTDQSISRNPPAAPIPAQPPLDLPLTIDPQLMQAAASFTSTAIGMQIDPHMASTSGEDSSDSILPPQPSLALGSSEPQSPRMKSNLRLFPPPVFSRQTLFQHYNLKANPMSVETTYVDVITGQEKKRLINRMRHRGLGPTALSYADKKVPEKPPELSDLERPKMNPEVLAQLQAKLKERPCWTLRALLNQFPQQVAKDIVSGRLVALVCYVFDNGPWRDILIRLGYDPRTDPSGRFYQRLYFRNPNHPIVRPSVTAKRQEMRNAAAAAGSRVNDDRSRAHIFDGQTLTSEVAAFQLCDITDPFIKAMIDNEDGLRDTCDERDGWYTTHAFERIKAILRHKFFSLLDGHLATDEECEAILSNTTADGDGTGEKLLELTTTRRQKGKHNMAKGALAPEEAAFQRLRATLDQRARDTASRE